VGLVSLIASVDLLLLLFYREGEKEKNQTSVQFALKGFKKE